MNEDKINSLVATAKRGGRDGDDAFDNIVDYMMPTIKRRVSTYGRVSNIPKDILEIDAISQLQGAIKKYDPSHKDQAKFKTFAEHYINKIRRTGYEYANIGYIPEHRIRKVNTFKKVKDNLERKLKRQPSSFELADELAWSVNEVERMQKELRSELIVDDIFNSSNLNPSEETDMLHYIRMELNPKEQSYYERLTGIGTNGKVMTPKETAKDMKVGISEVYNMKNRLSKKIDKILKKY